VAITYSLTRAVLTLSGLGSSCCSARANPLVRCPSAFMVSVRAALSC
jgi:hypothetical protein